MSRDATKADAAYRIAALLAPHCVQIEVAGSIRRSASTVRDIDIVAEPQRLPIMGLFSDVQGEVRDPAFDTALQRVASDVGLQRTSGGERLQNFFVPHLDCVLNLFLVSPPASWGAILLIRTGPSGYSHLLVTSRLNGGAMPPGMRQESGCLWQGMTRIETATEEDYCKAIGVPYWDPAGRSEGRLRAWLDRRRH